MKIRHNDWLWLKKISIKYCLPFDFMVGLFHFSSGLSPDYLRLGPSNFLYTGDSETENVLGRFYCGLSGIKFSAARNLGYTGTFQELLVTWRNLKIFGLFLNSLSVNNINIVLYEYKKISGVDHKINVKDIYEASYRIGPLEYE